MSLEKNWNPPMIHSWFEKYPNLNEKTVFQAALIVDFFPYIEKFYGKEYIYKDWGEPDDNLVQPIISLPCPKCQSMNRGYRGDIEVKNNTGSCVYCDYENVDLIEYIADMRHNGNKFKAAQEICSKRTIPYSHPKN